MRISGQSNLPQAFFFSTANGTGVVLEVTITATELFHVAGYEITLDAGGSSALAVDRCQAHGGKFCLHPKSGPVSLADGETLNARIGRMGRLKAGDSISASLLAEFPGEVSLVPKLNIRPNSGFATSVGPSTPFRYA